MPPRLPTLSAFCRAAPVASTPVAAFLAPLLQVRNASILGSLSDTRGAYNKRIRRGRGPSSGKGKTAGRGQKGQHAHGKVPARLQGGQTPEYIVKGSRGETNVFALDISPINLDRIQSWIDQGRLDPTKPITVKELAESRCLHGVKDGVKLLARNSEMLKTPINILVSRASAAAIETVEKLGGTVTTRYYTRQSIRRLLKGESQSSALPLSQLPVGKESPILSAAAQFQPFAYRLPDPTSRKDIEYYRDYAHRGYLSHLVEEGQGPSLFYKAPGTGPKTPKKSRKGGDSTSGSNNRLW